MVLRADFPWIREWSSVVEARTMQAWQAGDRRSSYLAGLCRHVDEHAKSGIGHNFTNFSDNLTDMSYSSHGWLSNVLGKF
jgi:hypothetical protein